MNRFGDDPPAGAAGEASPSPGAERSTCPQEALGEIWEALDSLPRAGTSPDMLATTLEMAAVAAEPPARPAAEPALRGLWREARPWAAGAVVVLAALATGLAAGRATTPNPELGILAHLPVVQHADLLREAGSVAFLEEVSRRGYAAPRRPPPTRSPEDIRADDEEFDAAIKALRSLGAATIDRETIAARRREVLALPEPARRQLEQSVERFQRFSSADRRELTSLGRALGDPARGELVEAARLWHRWIQLRDPADRRDVIDLGTADRLECLDRWTRFDPRDMTREGFRQWLERDREQRRRPPGPPPGPPPGFRPGFRPGPPQGRPAEPPRPPGPEVSDRGPGPRGETREPPR